jgi:hypothetical protein
MQANHLPTLGPRYWSALCLASIFGANMGDFFARNLGLGHVSGLPFLAAAQAIVIVAERYYWLAIIIVRTAATNFADFAAGDLKPPRIWVMARPIFRRGADNAIGRPRNIGASIAARACHMIGGLVPNRGWKRPFDVPIPLPDGRELVTLEDAGTYTTKLPKAEHEAPEWQAAMEALILVATSGGPTMLARIGALRALNRHHVREFNRKPHHWGKRNLKRDE